MRHRDVTQRSRQTILGTSKEKVRNGQAISVDIIRNELETKASTSVS